MMEKNKEGLLIPSQNEKEGKGGEIMKAEQALAEAKEKLKNLNSENWQEVFISIIQAEALSGADKDYITGRTVQISEIQDGLKQGKIDINQLAKQFGEFIEGVEKAIENAKTPKSEENQNLDW